MKTRVAFKKWYRNGWASPLAGLIGLWTWSWYSHVELILDDTYTEDENIFPLQYGFSASAWDNEVRIKPIDFYNDKWDILETDREINMEYIASVLGDGYDYLGIGLCELIPLKIHVKNRGYCSEVASCALGLEFCQNDPEKLREFIVDENLSKE